jgi:hypothetical protein
MAEIEYHCAPIGSGAYPLPPLSRSVGVNVNVEVQGNKHPLPPNFSNFFLYFFLVTGMYSSPLSLRISEISSLVLALL